MRRHPCQKFGVSPHFIPPATSELTDKSNTSGRAKESDLLNRQINSLSPDKHFHVGWAAFDFPNQITDSDHWRSGSAVLSDPDA